MSNGKRIKFEKRLIIYKLNISLFVQTHGQLITIKNQIHISFNFCIRNIISEHVKMTLRNVLYTYI